MNTMEKWIWASLFWLVSAASVSAHPLSYGMSGDDVTELQSALSEAGYFARTADGEYGSSTVAAVELFQKDKGLSVTGQADDATQRAVERARGKGWRSGGGVVYAKGNRGGDVERYQSKLAALGFLNGSADGVYGSGTENAVRQFQKDRDLPVSGVIDEATMAALDGSSGGTAAASKKAARSSGALHPGDSGDRVAKLQNLLILHGYDPGIVDGSYGGATENAVRQLQEDMGLDDDGIAGHDVMSRLQTAPIFLGSFKKVYTMDSTAYTPYDEGNTGFTAGGSIAGKGHAAVDPGVIPLGSLLYIEGYGYARADDIGGAVNGHTIDVGVDTLEQAYRWGTREVKVYLVQ